LKIFIPLIRSLAPISTNISTTTYLALAIVCGLNLAIRPGLAQTNPPAPPLQRIPQQPPDLLPIQPDPLPQRPNLPVVPQVPTAIGKIKVLRYEVLGSTVFSPQELSQITQPFTGEVTFEQLQAAKQAIEQKYLDRRYLTTGAYLPTGQILAIDGAVVRIQIVEGKLEAIRIKGTNRLNPDYIRSRLALVTQPPLNNDRLIEGLRLLQQDPLIESIVGELSSGIQPGTNLLEIQVKERQTFTSEIAINNYRSPTIGSWQRRAQIGQANLTGAGDSFVLAYSNTDGSNGIDVSYTMPLNPAQTTLSVNIGGTNSQIIEEPYRSIDLTTQSRYTEVSLRHPLIRRAQQDSTEEFALSVTGSKLESTSKLGDTPYPLSPGADNNGRIGVSALRFAQEYTYRDGRSVLALRSQLNYGVGAFNATIKYLCKINYMIFTKFFENFFDRRY
jgi:hemolysin activation/secretion protein